jgi:molecular chaperone DnaK
MSIGIGLPGGRTKKIIERNTPLPARKQYGLATTKDGQTEFELVVYQGESVIAAECEYLGTVRLTGLPPGPRGMLKIAVSFELGAECLLTVTARELNTGRQVQAVMSAREGPNAARKKLEQADPEKVKTGSFPVPTSPGMPIAGATPVVPPEGGALTRLLRRLFGGGPEAR